jgi:nucleoside-diphosphate-sugar epimerase
MLSDEKILVTGANGQIGLPLAQYLATDNEVWGAARFSRPETRPELEESGITPLTLDLATGDFSTVPDDFTYVVHLAIYKGNDADYDKAIEVDAEGTGLLLQHCARAKAALVMSTHSVYKPHDDNWHAFVETDALGDVNAPYSPTYSVSKIGEEAVARTCARAFNLPVTLARMNASYGPNGGLPASHMDTIVAGKDVVVRWDPQPYSPIHQDDINRQTAALLDAASVPATIVNWAGDEVVTIAEWCAHIGELTGRPANVVVQDAPGTLRGLVADITKRSAFTGPCTVGWREGFAQTLAARHPDVG